MGDNVWVGPGVGIVSADHDLSNYEAHKPSTPIHIGSNVWIGMNTVILAGVTIGDNVAIGAGSIVTKDIPANSIAAGVPCRVLREKPPYQGNSLT